MTASSVRPCPACSGTLFEAPERAGVFGCAGCGGIWADNATSQVVAVLMDPELANLADRAATFAARNTGAPLPRGGTRTCPECSAPLVRVNTASTNLDVCPTHGTWFDRGELQRVSRLLDADRDRQIPYAAKHGEWVTGDTKTALNTEERRQVGATAAEVATEVAVNVAIESVFIVFTALISSAANRDD